MEMAGFDNVAEDTRCSWYVKSYILHARTHYYIWNVVMSLVNTIIKPFADDIIWSDVKVLQTQYETGLQLMLYQI